MKDLFEKWKEIIGKRDGINYNVFKDTVPWKDKSMLDFAQYVLNNSWISVDDRLPEKEDADQSGKVLIWREYNFSNIKRSELIHFSAISGSSNPNVTTTHWQKPPKVPK